MNLKYILFGMAIYAALALVATIYFFSSRSLAAHEESSKIFRGNSKGLFEFLMKDADSLNPKNLSSGGKKPKAKKISGTVKSKKKNSKPTDNQKLFQAMRDEILGQMKDAQPVNHFPLINYQKYRGVNPYKKLGLYKNTSSKSAAAKKVTRFGIIRDESYCEQVDLYNLMHQDRLFSQFRFLTDITADSKIMKAVMDQQGTNLIPGLARTPHNREVHQLPFYLNAKIMKFNTLDPYEFNKEINCFSQIHNHIPGTAVISRKDRVTATLAKYTQRYASQPECLNGFNYPKSYRLSLKQECDEFFAYINSESYFHKKMTQPLQFLLKEGYNSHRADGVYLFDHEEETKLRAQFLNGSNCGTIKSSLVAQQYISNPLLLDKQNKFDFRIYMLVASAKPLIVYYHDGFLRVSLSKYDLFSQDKNVHLTNTHLSKAIFESTKKNESSTVTEEELRDYQMWTLEDLQDYLLKTNKTSDKNWLDNHLRPKFQQAFAHLSRAVENSVSSLSSVYELYGLDFVMDENLDIWFIECNVAPQIVGTNTRKTQLLTKMIQDMFEIQLAYYRSRMTRTFNFINNILKQNEQESTIDYPQLKKQFDTTININKLEPAFKISKTNGFVLVADKNLPNQKAYLGNIKQECLAL